MHHSALILPACLKPSNLRRREIDWFRVYSVITIKTLHMHILKQLQSSAPRINPAAKSYSKLL